MLKRRSVGLLVLPMSCALMLGACGGKVIPKKTVEDQIKTQQVGGQTPTKVSCPKDLDAKVGSAETCTVDTAAHEYQISATVTRVVKDRGYFALKLVKTVK
ncbi:MAG: hypothetical protein JWM71_1840 [Solirubrobacteraceae bacterium]|nr:hypothetical protein [Solirubrobacteraceae bacterium]